jgi:predicted nucleic acid-binding protein
MAAVVDASFAGAWILPDETSTQADVVLREVLSGAEKLAVPDLWSYEMANLLLSALRRGRIQERQVFEALRLVDCVPCTFHDAHSRLIRERIGRLAVRFHLSAYDAAYLELADRLQCKLYTNDGPLSQAASALGL